MAILRIIATILSGPLLLIGIIWAIYGAPMAVVGAGLVWWVNRGGQTR